MKLQTRNHRTFTWAGLVAAFAALGLTLNSVPAADNQEASSQNQEDLIKVLLSDAQPPAKALACKRLAVFGGKEAVPALAPLLTSPDLASWARIALEAIPDPTADQALREALSKTQGRLLVGVINSIGYRQDVQAVSALAPSLKGADPEVASAAAAALGRIANEEAAKALVAALDSAPDAVRSEVAEGCIRCAEKRLAQGKRAAATGLYDTVRKAKVPKNRQLEAIRGAILAQQSIPLLLEQLRSPDKAFFGLGLRTAREFPTPAATKALIAELPRNSPERRAALLAALGDRADASALPAFSQAVAQGPAPVRAAAIDALEHLNSPAVVPVLLDAAVGNDPAAAQKAKIVLGKLSAGPIDADILNRLSKGPAKTRQALIEVAALRRIEAALPVIVAYTSDSDRAVRGAAVATVGTLGREKEAGELVRLLGKTSSPDDRTDLEKALLAICGRRGAQCEPALVPLARSSDRELRKIALHALASAGGPAALAAVTDATKDPDESVQDEAVRTLSSWSSTWPEDAGVAEPLLTLAKSGKKVAHQVLGVRGYLDYVHGAANLSDAEKLSKVNALLPLINRPEEKRLAIPVISAISNGGALELLLRCAEDPAVAEDAYLAIVTLATKRNLKEAPKELREKGLRLVAEKSSDQRTKARAEEALAKLQ